VTPDPDGRLSEGVVVEARVRGRLLGAPILRLDAEVVLSPARVGPPVAGLPSRPLPPPAGSRQPALGTSLGEAVRLLEQSADCLRSSAQAELAATRQR